MVAEENKRKTGFESNNLTQINADGKPIFAFEKVGTLFWNVFRIITNSFFIFEDVEEATDIFDHVWDGFVYDVVHSLVDVNAGSNKLQSKHHERYLDAIPAGSNEQAHPEKDYKKER